jgi:hypothetical protein
MNDGEARCSGQGDVDEVWGINCVVLRLALIHKTQTQHQRVVSVSLAGYYILLTGSCCSRGVHSLCHCETGKAKPLCTWIHGDGF